MPFKHTVNKKLDIVVLKAKGEVSVVEIISEIQEAINTKRGDGITRRLIDLTDQEFTFQIKDAQTIITVMKASADILGSKRIAVLLKEIPDSFDFEKIRPFMNSSNVDIDFFTDKEKAIQFFNKPSNSRKKL